ncbi:MAG: hypothetical protein ACK5Q5_07400 [Planctomycetaceae bacterium]
MTTVRCTSLLVIALLALMITSQAAKAVESPPAKDGVISRDELIATVRRHEEQLHSWSYSFASRSWKPGEEETADTWKGELRTRVDGSSYYLEAAAVSTWTGGVAPFISERLGMSFDGIRHRYWRHSRHGRELPPEIADPEIGREGVSVDSLDLDGTMTWPEGRIAFEPMPGHPLTAYQSVSGMSFLPPAIPPPLQYILPADLKVNSTAATVTPPQHTKFSDFLGSIPVNRLSCRRREGRYLDVRIDDPAPESIGILLMIDDGYHGLVKSAKSKLPTPELAAVDFEWQYDADGKAPRELHVKDLYRPLVVKISELQANPELTGASFAVRFPPGTDVTDEELLQFYRNGETVAEKEATEAYLQRYGLSPR